MIGATLEEVPRTLREKAPRQVFLELHTEVHAAHEKSAQLWARASDVCNKAGIGRNKRSCP